MQCCKSKLKSIDEAKIQTHERLKRMLPWQNTACKCVGLAPFQATKQQLNNNQTSMQSLQAEPAAQLQKKKKKKNGEVNLGNNF